MLTNYRKCNGIKTQNLSDFLVSRKVILKISLLVISVLRGTNITHENGVLRAKSVTLTLFCKFKFTFLEIAALHYVSLAMTKKGIKKSAVVARGFQR
ncbi:MAG: hypothetical protein DI539_03490 [Flavobacterium psychrophilum]|nr:MAG: hypothetical protein DI539_03490 [Flavobacterium psychrophilum]